MIDRKRKVSYFLARLTEGKINMDRIAQVRNDRSVIFRVVEIENLWYILDYTTRDWQKEPFDRRLKQTQPSARMVFPQNRREALERE